MDIIAAEGDTIDDYKYTVSKNPPLTGLYYRLHILNVWVSDIKKYKCEAVVNSDSNVLFAVDYYR